MKHTGIVWDPSYLNHQTDNGHPESRQRLLAIYAMLEQIEAGKHFTEITPRPATAEEILMVHSPEYLQKVAATEGLNCVALTGDTSIDYFSNSIEFTLTSQNMSKTL